MMADSNDEAEQSEIRDELSKMSFEDLQKLKSKLGAKVYNEAMFGSKKVVKEDFKRANKNRPRELSSKKAERVVRPKPKRKDVRDPRFDSLCGTYDEKRFKKAYGFIDKIRSEEKAQLIKQLRKQTDPDEKKKIRSVLQRLKNKEREELKKQQKEEQKMTAIEEKVKALKEGRKPYFRSKLETKVADLVDQYSKLKQTGKLVKHIEKKRKKQGQQERKSGALDAMTM